MRVDIEVNRRKYDLEVERLSKQRSALEARGIFLLSTSEFPYINLFYTPRVPLRLLLPPPTNAPKDLPPNAMAMIDIPSIAGRGFTARIDLSDYDIVAPSIEFFDPWSNLLLPYVTMFRAIEFEQQRGPHNVLLPDHPTTHKPFLCLRGVREYHEHPQHTGDDWFLYRDKVSVFSVVNSLWRVAIDLVRPQVVFRPHDGQMQVQVQWAPEAKA